MKILRAELSYFKGIKSLAIDFFDKTDIRGRNAIGKSTIVDAINWVFTGKDSFNRDDFDIKTRDSQNQYIDRVDHSVKLFLEIDGFKNSCQRIYKEKWSKKTGNPVAEFIGHTEDFFWNDVPMQKKDFMAEVGKYFTELQFRLLSNPAYFNTINWQDRRKWLLKLAGDISNNDILNAIAGEITDEQYGYIHSGFAQNKTPEAIQKQILSEKSIIKDQLDGLKHSIPEAKLAIPDILDYAQLAQQITEIEAKIQDIDETLSDKSKQQRERQAKIIEVQNKIFSCKQAIQTEEFKIKSDTSDARQKRETNISNEKSTLRQLQNDLSDTQRNFNSNTEKIAKLAKERDSIRAKWDKENERSIIFDESDFRCPTCNRMFDDENVSERKTEMEKNFNESKIKNKSELNASGKDKRLEQENLELAILGVGELIKNSQNEIDLQKQKLSDLEKLHNSLSSSEANNIIKAIANSPEIISQKKTIEDHQQEIKTIESEYDNNAELTSKKTQLYGEIKEINKKLATKPLRDTQLLRVQSLIDKETELGVIYTTHEGVEFAISLFIRKKMDLVEETVNRKFKVVKFKLFNRLVNGSEEPICDMLVPGEMGVVSYKDANTAGKINGGIDCIRTFSDHMNMHLPLLVDCAESVNEVLDAGSQSVQFVVTLDKKLSIRDSSKPQKSLFEQENKY